jgi:hypothetical protein
MFALAFAFGPRRTAYDPQAANAGTDPTKVMLELYSASESATADMTMGTDNAAEAHCGEPSSMPRQTRRPVVAPL